MKIALLFAGACGLVVLGGLLWVVRSPSGSVSSSPGARSEAEAAGETAKLLPVGGPAADERTTQAEPAAPAADAKAPVVTRLDAPPAQVPLASGDQSITTPIANDLEQQPDLDGFAAKYAGLDETGFKQALEQVEAVLAEQREGRFGDKAQALPAEALAALERERAWLKERAYP